MTIETPEEDLGAGVTLPRAPTAATGTYALLSDGRTVEIRPARPQDAAAVREMHAAMSADNMYLRFFSLSPLMGHQLPRAFTRVWAE